jgi:Zn-finger nucleic acid-binding protein
MITGQCTACGAHYKVRDGSGGKIAKCKKCGATITVPLANANSSLPRGSDKDTIKYKCPECNCKLENPGSMGGRFDKCPLCGFNHPVPLTKGQRKVIAARKATEAKAAKAAALRQQREEAEKLRSLNEVSASQPVRSDDRPPPISLPAKKSKATQIIIAVIILMLCGGGIAAYLIFGSANGKPRASGAGRKVKPVDLESIKDFAVIARKIRMGIAEGITFNDLGEKVFKLRDAYAMIDRQAIPVSLVRKADESFKECKKLREIWRKHIYENEEDRWKKLMQGQMHAAGLTLTEFLSEYDSLERN